MNFDRSDEAKALGETARSFLSNRAPLTEIRRVHDGEMRVSEPLWRDMADMGWLGTCIPEEYGGLGLGEEFLCVLAEEVGRALAPVPFASSACMATTALVAYGDPSLKEDLLPGMAAGTLMGTMALAEGIGDPEHQSIQATVEGGVLHGKKLPVPDGLIADFAIVAARDTDGSIGLYVCFLEVPGVNRQSLETTDPSRNMAVLGFEGATVRPLTGNWQGAPSFNDLLERFAVFAAFEQIGGAAVCLEMARDYALERYAFGRPIGSFQAIKHKLAEVYIACELARANAMFATWALEEKAPELAPAAAAARLSSSDAFQLAARENIQTHGGIGITWEADCHLFFRRAKSLGLELGSPLFWQERLISQLDSQQDF